MQTFVARLQHAPPWRRRLLVPWMLLGPVLLGHWLLAQWWSAERFGFGDAVSRIARIDVAFVRELQPAAPPAAPPPRAVPPATRVLRVPPAASAPDGAERVARALSFDAPLRVAPLPAATSALPELAPAPELTLALAPAAPASATAPEPGTAPGTASAAPGTASALPSAGAPASDSPALDAPPPSAPAVPVAAAAAATPGAAASAAAFEWPPSTRLSYLLTGNFRGPVEGQARVEWRMAGSRYQVSLEVGIGPPFAPLVTRTLQSDGLVTAAGLEPRRYEEETHVALRAPRRLAITLDAERVRLPSGRELPRPPGVQDSASQFVQMTWLFTTRRALLQAGTALQFPLALPRHVNIWTYEVIGEETLATPVGAIDAVHVRPRRPPSPAGLPGGGGQDLTAEFWVAPTLQYLPVRILIRQDEETYVDLHLERLPQQAAAPASR